MDPALVIVLSEHLGWVAENPESIPHSEYISQSRSAWFAALSGFAELEESFAKKIDEWRDKWQQRFEIEGTAKIISSGAEAIKQIKNAKEKEKKIKDLYLDTVHLMIGDAQKYMVTIISRAELLQENIRKSWHKNCGSDSYSKILPSIENSLQSWEESFFADALTPEFARQEFAETIKLTDDCDAILNMYFSKIFRHASKFSCDLCKFYSKKWALYSRGFRSRQNLLPLE